MRAQKEWESLASTAEVLKEWLCERTYHIVTYGCQMNVNESQQLAGMLEDIGMVREDELEKADLVLFNTCCVREGAEDRVRGNIGALRQLKTERPEMLLGVCGCMMQQKGKAAAFMKRFPFVDFVFGTHDHHMLYAMLADALDDNRSMYINDDASYAEGIPVKHDGGTIGSVTVMHGCNNFCSYCIVPYVRGRERSRKIVNVCRDVEGCVAAGAKEILLLGQNVNSYNDDGMDFADLLRRVSVIPGVERIRFMTSHPKDLSDRLIDAYREIPSLMPHLHLPQCRSRHPVYHGHHRWLSGRGGRGFPHDHGAGEKSPLPCRVHLYLFSQARNGCRRNAQPGAR